MQKTPWLSKVLISVLIYSLAGTANATDYFVRISGSDKSDGLTPKTAFQTMNFAITKCTSSKDQIFVGGGTYEVSIARSFKPNQALEIIGDISGKKTGDAGRPIFVSKPNTWTLSLSNGRSLLISGVQFEGHPGSNYYGMNIGGMTSSVQISDCVFRSLYMASNFVNNGEVIAENCEFDKLSHIGMYARNGTLGVRNCQFNNCRYAVYGQDLKKVALQKSQFQADGSSTRLAVYMNNCATNVDTVQFVGYETAIYSVNSQSLDVADTKISDIKSWGIYGTGGKCDISNVTITGRSTKTGYGFFYSRITGSKPNLSNVDIQTVYCGIRSDGNAEYDFKNVYSAGNQIGYLATNQPELKLDRVRKGTLLLDNNVFGMYVASSVDKPGNLSLSNSEISNNDYGLYTNNTSVRLDSCVFQKNSRAVFILNSPEATVSKCELSDNTARNTWSHVGLRIDARRASVSDTNIARNDYGLYITNLADETPALSNLRIDGNKDYGLQVVRGQLHLDNATNVQVSGSRFGLWTNGTAVSIDSWEGPASADYPYYLTRGSLDMRGCIIANGVIGVYAHTLSNITLQKCRIRDQSNHGLFVHLPGRLSVDSCFIESVKSHALYCNTAGVPGETVSINNLSVSNSQIAARFIGVPISSKNLRSIVLRNNAQGLRVEQATLDLSPEMNVDATGNQYAVMSYNGRLVADGYSSENNLFALYVFRSPTELINTKLSGKSYGALFYGSRVSASGLRVSASNYGIYHDPQNQKDCPLSIVDSQFNDIGSFAIRAVGRDNSKDVELKNLQIIGGNYGLYFSNNKVVAEDIRCSDVKFYAYFANNSESQLRRLVSNRCGSWAIYGLAGSLSLFDSQVHGGQGVLLATHSSSAVNCIVSGAAYGFYLNRKDGEYAVLNSTISGIRIDGILANLGKVKVVNSIIQSGRFGIHDVTGSNTIHDYNIITSGRAPFRNTVAEKNEILKLPMFVNAAAGDFRLTSGSPAINSGLDLSAVSKTDIVGAARGSYGRFEIGAYEFTEKHGSLRVLDWDETAE